MDYDFLINIPFLSSAISTQTVWRISPRTVKGFLALLAPHPGWVKESRSGIRDEHPGSYFQELRNNLWVKNTVLKFFDVDPDLGSGIFLLLDPGWKYSNPA